ncbi:MAG TPA: hypothetical protein EYN67_06790 [Flavobacteriales bacterium]|nr:hypothetical protein [Flavobacteriales bacterium]
MPELLLKPNDHQIGAAKNNIRKLLNSPIGEPKKVVVILTASRSGSSCLFDVLSRSPSVVSLQGEIEPYLKLTGNAVNEDYLCGNRLDKIDNILELKTLVRGELCHKHISVESHLINSIHIRKILQWPGKDTARFEDVDQSWYDGKLEDREAQKHKVILEEPPFVMPTACSYPLSLSGKVIIFKTPQNVYRPSLFKELFPVSEIQYIHLKRSFAATVNGLMDGWLHKRAFFAYKVGGLNIKNYNYYNWWCFDLYPGWYDDKNKRLIEVCLNQWANAHSMALKYNISLSYKFEEVVAHPQRMIHTICRDIGIEPPHPIDLKLTMATSSPKKYRWHKRKEEILLFAKKERIRTIMKQLLYPMTSNDWT